MNVTFVRRREEGVKHPSLFADCGSPFVEVVASLQCSATVGVPCEDRLDLVHQ